MLRSLGNIFAVVLLVMFTRITADKALSAQISILRKEAWRSTGGDPRCSLRLTGGIEEGDAARLKVALSGLLMTDAPGSREEFFICLDSTGGSYAEGLRLAKTLLALNGKNVSTVIPRGAKCHSSCALVFMAAPRRRFLHKFGLLGFHAPYLNDIPDSTFDKKTVVNAFRLAQLGVEELIKIFSVSRSRGTLSGPATPVVKASLFQTLLTQGPDELFLIDTVDKAGRWGISVYGDARPVSEVGFSSQLYARACLNNYHWEADSYASSYNQPPSKVETLAIELNGEMKTRNAILIDKVRGLYCLPGFTAYEPDPPHRLTVALFTLLTKSKVDSLPSTTQTLGAEPWQGFAPDTLLVDLP